ncbi:MAG: polysaccharide biosynthesis tyrosine autokinase [Bacteroidota bacterium]
MELYKKEDFFGESSLDFRALIKKLKQKWYYFLVSIPTFVLGALAYIYFAQPVYQVGTSLLVYEKKTNQLGDSQYNEGGIMLNNSEKNIQNEIGIINSFNLVKQTLEDLQYNVSFYSTRNFRTRELYSSKPYDVILEEGRVQIIGTPITVIEISETQFAIELEADEYNLLSEDGLTITEVKEPYAYTGTCAYGEVCETDKFAIRIFREDEFVWEEEDTGEYFFVINNPDGLVQSYLNKLEVGVLDEDATIVNLTTEGPIVQKERDFLAMLCRNYIANQLEEKNQAAQATADFIENQLTSAKDTLRRTENIATDIAQTSESVNLDITAAAAVEQLRNLQVEKDRYSLNNRYYTTVLNQLENNTNPNSIPAPGAMGITDDAMSSLIINLKQLNQQKVERSITSGSGGIELTILDSKIENAQRDLTEYVRSYLNTTRIQISDINARISRVKREVRKLPVDIQLSENINRKKIINENLVSYLMQKQAEAEIARAANSPDSKMLDEPRQIGDGPVAPKKVLILLAAMVLGLGLPIIMVVAGDLFNDKVLNSDQITDKSSAPILGNIVRGQTESERGLITYDNLTSPVSESFRFLKVNLQFLAVDKTKKVIGLTSTVPGEGKTFCALNLASILAISGKRTLIIGADIRKPKLFERSRITNEVGLSSYLINQAMLDEIIQNSDLENLDIVPSGPVPPNPAELIDSPKLSEMFEILKGTYEYIVVDTPPVGLVSDFLILSKYMDINLYVVRQGYSKIEFLSEIDKVRAKGKLNNLYVLFNDVKMTSAKYTRYGYDKYGYSGVGYKAKRKQYGKYVVKRLKNKYRTKEKSY